jgi:uracil-DNA glycosylase family 4
LIRGIEPADDCSLCPRLAEMRSANKIAEPDWHNAPVPNFGGTDSRLLIVGLAPGLRGANRTGRPFTGDFAGGLLYETLIAYGFAEGRYEARADDGLDLNGCVITNAVRCVPPQNKPTAQEIGACRGFLRATIDALPDLEAIVALGRVAHESVVRALGLKAAALPFAHGAEHRLTHPGRDGLGAALALFDSYHCSRYNTNTGVLTPQMFHSVFANVRKRLGR